MLASKRSIALRVAAGFVALVALAIGWLFFADLGFLKPHIERWVSERSGRVLRVDGELSIDLGANSVIIARGVRFENAAWAKNANMLDVERLEVHVRLRSLFDGPPVIELIDLDNALIDVATSETGVSNWALVEPATATDTSAARSTIRIKEIDVRNVRIGFASPQRSSPLLVNIESLTQHPRADEMLDYALDARLGDRRLTLDGTVGTWPAILAGKDILYDLEGKLDAYIIASSGRIDDLTRPARPELRFTAAGPDIDISGSLTPRSDGPLILELHGEAGNTHVDASGSFSNLQDLDEIDIKATARGDDLGQALARLGMSQDLKAPFEIDVDAKRQGPLLIVRKSRMEFGSATFDLTAHMPAFPALSKGVFELDINGPDVTQIRGLLQLPGSATGSFSVHSELSPNTDETNLLVLSIDTSLVELQARADLTAAENHVGSDIELQLSSKNLGEVANVFGISGLPKRPIEMRGRAKIVDAGIEATEDILANVEKISIAVNGLFAREKGLRGSDLNFKISGPNLAALAADFGVSERVPHDAYSIGGKLLVRDSDIGLSRVTGTVGKSSIRVDGGLVAGKRLAGSALRVAANGPALEQLARTLDPVTVAAGPYDVSGTVAFKSGSVSLRDFRLVRDRGEADFDIEFGLAPADRSIGFDVTARGPDIRAILQNYRGFEPAKDSFTLDTRGRFSDARWSFDKFELTVGKAQMQANGTLDFRGEGEANRFYFSGDIPSLAAIGQFDGRTALDQRLTWQANMISRDSVVNMDDLRGRLGEHEFTGAVEISLGDTPEVNLNLLAGSLALRSLFEDLEPISDKKAAEDGRLIPDYALPLGALRKVNGSVDLSIGDLQRGELRLRNVELLAALRDGHLDVSNLAFDAPAGHLDARFSIQEKEDSADVSIAIVARDFSLGLMGRNKDLEMTSEVDISIESKGDNLRTLAANANGIAFAKAHGGQLTDLEVIHLFYGDMFSQILGTISPLLVSETGAQLECAIFPYEITGGQLTSVPVTFIGTDKVHIKSATRVDLSTEELDFDVQTTPSKGLKLSAGQILNPQIEVVGTLAEPRVAVDAQGTIVSGGAAVATGGVTLLAKLGLQRLLGSRDPCTEIEAHARDALGDRFPQFSTTTSEQ